MSNWVIRPTLVALLVGLLVCGSMIEADAQNNFNLQRFKMIFPLAGVGSYPPEDMVANCGGEFTNARAWMLIQQHNGKTRISIWVRRAVPNTLFTVWLRLASHSPLTGSGVTALANPSDIEELAAATPEGNLTPLANALGLDGTDGPGVMELANGFHTDKHGNGKFQIDLDFPIVKGAFQFQEFHESLAPIPTNDVPAFRLRLASHCDDPYGHGLVPGRHEMWFDWPNG